jgi:hypothetical protein
MASSRVGYYTQDDGEDRFYYFMGDDPPLEQYILRQSLEAAGRWLLLDGHDHRRATGPHRPSSESTQGSPICSITKINK